MVLWLASDDSRMCTAQLWVVDARADVRLRPTPMTYDQFWLRYLRAHSRTNTRALHYIGSLLALATLLIGDRHARLALA